MQPDEGVVERDAADTKWVATCDACLLARSPTPMCLACETNPMLGQHTCGLDSFHSPRVVVGSSAEDEMLAGFGGDAPAPPAPASKSRVIGVAPGTATFTVTDYDGKSRRYTPGADDLDPITSPISDYAEKVRQLRTSVEDLEEKLEEAKKTYDDRLVAARREHKSELAQAEQRAEALRARVDGLVVERDAARKERDDALSQRDRALEVVKKVSAFKPSLAEPEKREGEPEEDAVSKRFRLLEVD